MKIYRDLEYCVQGECCVGCGTKKDVFYDRSTDFFVCHKCKEIKNYFPHNRDKEKKILEIAFEIAKIRKIMLETKNSDVLEVYKRKIDELVKLQIKIDSK